MEIKRTEDRGWKANAKKAGRVKLGNQRSNKEAKRMHSCYQEAGCRIVEVAELLLLGKNENIILIP